MSLTYYPTAKIKPHCDSQFDHGGFDANTASATLLGVVHHQFGLPMSEFDNRYHQLPRPAYVLDKAAARAAGDRLSEIPDDKIAALLPEYHHFFEGSPADFVKWVRDWQQFLIVCGGYDTDPP